MRGDSMGVNKVEFGGETLIDLTGDTVMPQSLLRGYSAHNKAGELIEGLAVIPTVGNGTVTIKQNGANKGTFTMNQSGNTTIELTDNNTTYGAATQSTNGLMTAADKKKLDGLTPTTSLAVTQEGTSILDGTVGKILNDKFGGCSLEQEGEDFYIVGADAVRKKLGDLDAESIDISSQNVNVSFSNGSGNSVGKVNVGVGFTLYKTLFPTITHSSTALTGRDVIGTGINNTYTFSYDNHTGILSINRYIPVDTIGSSVSLTIYKITTL